MGRYHQSNTFYTSLFPQRLVTGDSVLSNFYQSSMSATQIWTVPSSRFHAKSHIKTLCQSGPTTEIHNNFSLSSIYLVPSVNRLHFGRLFGRLVKIGDRLYLHTVGGYHSLRLHFPLGLLKAEPGKYFPCSKCSGFSHWIFLASIM